MLCLQVSVIAFAEGDNFGPPSNGLTDSAGSFIEAFISKKGDSERLSVLAGYSKDWENRQVKIDYRILHVLIGLDSDQAKNAAVKTVFMRGVFSGRMSQDSLLNLLARNNRPRKACGN